MPDDFDLDAVRARQAAAREAAAVELDQPDTGHLARLEIERCSLCDDDGYSGNRVCDHRDRTQTVLRGRALVDAELAKIRQRRAGTAHA